MHAANDMKRIGRIRELAGQIGATRFESPQMADAENYESQVQIGLALSATEILDYDSSRVVECFGHFLIACGVEIDPLTEALLNALESKLESRSARERRFK
jgi:hypothetical protein